MRFIFDLATASAVTAAIAGLAAGQCVNDCGLGDVAEGEPCPGNGYVDLTNGGCNGTPNNFTIVTCDTTICGTAATYDDAGVDHRDTDWYLVSQAQLDAADGNNDGLVELRATFASEFTGFAAIFAFAPDCSNVLQQGSATFSDGSCTPDGFAHATIAVADHPFGVLVIVAPDVFDGYECGTGLNDYTLFIECGEAPAGCTPGNHPCNEVNPAPGCGDAACCNFVCGLLPDCCAVAWDEACVAAAVEAGCATEPFPDVCLATGPDPSADGYLEVCVDPYGAWASTAYGGSGDLFNPAGAPGPQPVAYTSGFFFVNPVTFERELLANNLSWQSLMPADGTLDRQVVLGSVTADTNGDGVDDKAFSMFRVTGADFSLRFYLEQQVESAGPGVATLTQYYAVINEGGNYVDFNLVRHLDADLVWDGDYGDDSTGTFTNNDPIADRHVFQRETGDPTTSVTMSSSWGFLYYGAKNGVDPDGGGPGPAMSGGTSTILFDHYGIPFEWEDYVAGLGYDVDGESGPSPAGCLVPCDAHIAMDHFLQTDASYDPILTLRHTFGSSDPVPIDPCGALISGSCVAETNTPGCDNAACCNLVCASDPFCCDTAWDFLCVGAAEQECDGFVQEQALAAGLPSQETVGDLNGDGLNDAVAVMSNQDLQANGAIQVFLNLGTLADGQWLQFVPLPPITVGRDPSAVAAGLFNQDAHLDLAVTNKTDGTVTILLNNGLGNASFTTSQIIPVGAAPSDITVHSPAFGTDLVVTLEGDEAFVTLVNDGFGTFVLEESPPGFLGFGPVALFSDDFDSNKCPDLSGAGQSGALAAESSGMPGRVFIALEQLDGTYDTTVYIVGTDPRDVAAGDFNEDGHRDIVVPDAATGEFWVLYGDGSGELVTQDIFIIDAASQLVAVTVADFDSDGCDGIAILDASFPGIGPAVLVLPRQCGQGFEIGFAFGVDAIPQAIAASDINGDCVPDIVTANETFGGVGGSVSTLLSTLLPILFPCCPWDLDGDGAVGTTDFLGLLGQWGSDPGGPPDFDFSGDVGTTDFLTLLGHWGPCQQANAAAVLPPGSVATWNVQHVPAPVEIAPMHPGKVPGIPGSIGPPAETE